MKKEWKLLFLSFLIPWKGRSKMLIIKEKVVKDFNPKNKYMITSE